MSLPSIFNDSKVKINTIKFCTNNKERNERAHDLKSHEVELIDNDSREKGNNKMKTLISIYLTV